MKIEASLALQREVFEVLNRAMPFCNIVRGSEFQERLVRDIDSLKPRADAIKRQYIAAQSEDGANTCLCLIEILEVFAAELRMWILLKKKQPDDAWDSLIDAQGHAERMLSAHQFGSVLGYLPERLLHLERLLFPPQLFISSGLIIRSTRCSICGAPYELCDHQRGKPYMGEFCVSVVEKIEGVREVSFVSHPAQKQCRALGITADGAKRNYMTWRPSESQIE